MFIVCFSLNNRLAFENVRNKWYPEIRHYCPDTPWIIVGTKSDLRNEWNDKDLVSTFEGQNLAGELGAWGYYECSARTGDGVKPVFDNVIRYAIMGKNEILKQKRRKTSFINSVCTVM